jgi:hypothetical protein
MLLMIAILLIVSGQGGCRRGARFTSAEKRGGIVLNIFCGAGCELPQKNRNALPPIVPGIVVKKYQRHDPSSHRLPAASILMVSVIFLLRAMAHDICNVANIFL